MTPSLSLKSSNALPITVPICGKVSARAYPSPADTNMSPLLIGPRTLHGTRPSNARATTKSPLNYALASRSAAQPASSGWIQKQWQDVWFILQMSPGK